MKLGLIADIHEHIKELQKCIQRLEAEGVDRIVMLGDVFELGHRIASTCELLSNAKAGGVWGNHDFGLCVGDSEEFRQQYSDVVVDYMQSLTSELVIDDCYFAHIEPWLDPSKLEDLWFFDGMPQTDERRQQIFSSKPHRVFFAGHYHRWMLVSPEQTEPWDGTEPICLDDGPYFVVLNALVHGTFATYDTTTKWMTPFQL